MPTTTNNYPQSESDILQNSSSSREKFPLLLLLYCNGMKDMIFTVLWGKAECLRNVLLQNWIRRLTLEGLHQRTGMSWCTPLIYGCKNCKDLCCHVSMLSVAALSGTTGSYKAMKCSKHYPRELEAACPKWFSNSQEETLRKIPIRMLSMLDQ